MTLTSYIAELLGLYMVVAGVLMVVKRKAVLELMPKFVENPALTYLLGSLRVLIGLAIVLARDAWAGTLGMVLLIIGWLTLLRGIAMLLLPLETERKLLAAFTRNSVWYASAAVAIVVGAWLAYAGFTA
jgi:hypothetical protein